MAKALPALSALFLLLSACGPKTTGEGELNTTEITFPNGRAVLAETMRQQVDQMRGMMFRDSLAKDRGMLFVHPSEMNVPYWMYQVRIPLDIIWMDHQRRIVEISANTAACTAKSSHDCPSYGGNEKARYVLELAGGGAALYGLKVGDTLTF
ncbi:MAG TPA: DUF192 domain-containing protein [Bryobacteraceae bacterium]|nr:DUF192 domain-containing protein [Bryobacteraceae bacterium]